MYSFDCHIYPKVSKPSNSPCSCEEERANSNLKPKLPAHNAVNKLENADAFKLFYRKVCSLPHVSNKFYRET